MPRGRKALKSEVINESEVVVNDSSIGPVDVHVGKKICARRRLLQLSQKQMAEKLGITFQQVQKYEKGLNRIGAGRLYSIANILGVDIDYFFEEADPASADYHDVEYNSCANAGFLREDSGEFLDDPMHGTEAVMLLKAFYSLPQKTRLAILNLLASLKDKDDKKDSDA